METLKKIGILTWYNHGNYGSALQAYALKTFLEKLGYKAQIIPYIPQWERSLLNANFLKKCKRFVKMLLGYCFECTPFKKNRFCDPFIYFRLNFLKLKGQCTEIDIAEYTKNFTTIISGSDQIWNPSFIDYVFLQNFEHDNNIRKISYAASLGVMEMNNNQQRTCYKKMLASFHAISVREYAGKKILNSLGISCEVHADPALLLNAIDYRKMYKSINWLKKKYIFCYILRTTKISYKDCILEYANNYNLDVIGISYDKADYSWMKDMSTCSPREWLWLIDNAEIVMTNSYHATIFSLIFHTVFFTFVRFPEENSHSQNSRIDQLVQFFGIEKYIVDGNIPHVEKYDFNYFENHLQQLQCKASKYLKTNIF